MQHIKLYGFIAMSLPFLPPIAFSWPTNTLISDNTPILRRRSWMWTVRFGRLFAVWKYEESIMRVVFISQFTCSTYLIGSNMYGGVGCHTISASVRIRICCLHSYTTFRKMENWCSTIRVVCSVYMVSPWRKREEERNCRVLDATTQ